MDQYEQMSKSLISVFQVLVLSECLWVADRVKNTVWKNKQYIFIEHIKIEKRTVIVVKINGLNHEINN